MFMKNIKINFVSLFFLFLLFGFLSETTFAHVTLVQPQGGDVVRGGSRFTIKWEIDEDVERDENWDIRFSSDNGKNWDVVVANLKSTERNFVWDVPDISTTVAIIEVIEDLPEDADDGARSNAFTIESAKSFTFKCGNDFAPWVLGIEKMTIELNEEQACVLKLTRLEPGLEIEISSHMRDGVRSSIEVFPSRGITDKNGELTFSIVGVNEGIDWVSWAVRDDKGKFLFNKRAYDEGTAWGMVVEVK